MRAEAWPVVVLVLAAVVVIAWPAGSGRSRHRRLFPTNRQIDHPGAAAPPVPGADRVGLSPAAGCAPSGWRSGPTRAMGRRTSFRPPNRRDVSRPTGAVEGPAGIRADPLPDTAGAHQASRAGGATNRPRSAAPWRSTVLVTAAATAAVAGLLGGPVAAAVAATYTALGLRALRRRRTTVAAERLRRRRLDQLGALAADLRAGLPVPVALADETAPLSRVDGAPDAPTAPTRPGLDRIDRLTRAAARLADRTGAPLAELVERVEADMRATDRGLAGAAAQAAGARATAWLLAALPLGGIALGYGIGVDPVEVLLETPVGAVCAIAATGLQTAGLLWAERLSALPEVAA